MRDLQEVLGWLKLSLERLSLSSDPAIFGAGCLAPCACRALHREVVPCPECPPPAASRLEQNVQCAPAAAGSAVGASCQVRTAVTAGAASNFAPVEWQ